MSLFLKENRSTYYALLDDVRRDGDWEAWLAFFLEGVRITAEGALSTAERLTNLFREDRDKISGRGRKAGSAMRVHEALKARPITSMQEVRRRSGLSFPTASSSMELLSQLGIARELTGRRRNRLFAYEGYLRLLNEGSQKT